MSATTRRNKRKGRKTTGRVEVSQNGNCPFCGNAGDVANSEGSLWCSKCCAFFDDDPEEGGDYSDRNVALRLEREERKR